MSKLTLLEPRSLTEAMEFSEVLSKSGMVPDHYQGKPSNVLVAIQWGYELGLAPMQALQNISVINGKPSIWGDAMLALVKAHPAFRGMLEQIEGSTAVCEVKREMENGDIETTRCTFSIEEAQKAGLTNKRGPWQSYPNRMLKLRARGFALRDAFPDAIKGLITTEEAKDYPSAEKQSPERATQAPVVASDGNGVQNIVNALSESSSVSNDIAPPPELILTVPNRKDVAYNSELEWADAYSTLMVDMFDCKLKPEEKRTKLKELEKLNEVSFGQLEHDLSEELKQKRKNLNALLSVQAREDSHENRPHS